MTRLLPLSLIVLLGACAHLHPAPPVTLHPADSGKSVDMTVGQTITVRLPATLSTGYAWQKTKDPDPRVLIVTASGYDEPVSAPGAAGEAWWKLRATGSGTTDLALRYVRPWEPDKDAGQFALTVVVK